MWILQCRTLGTAFEIFRGSRDGCEREAYKRYNACPKPGTGWNSLMGLPGIPRLEIRLIKAEEEQAPEFIPSEEC